MRVTIISLRDGAKALLTGCVPELQLHHLLAVNSQCLYLEVNSNRAEVALIEGVVCESQKHGCLSGVTLADQNYLEERIEIIRLVAFRVLFNSLG